MSPRVVVVDAAAPDAAALEDAADVLRRGGLVAFPTETVYGLGARALDKVHVRRIYEAKGRPSANPLIVHVASVAAAGEVAVLEDWIVSLGAALWPGPVTFVLPRRPHVPDEVTGGGATVAVRVPAHPVALGLLRALGEPLAAPSANRSTELSPTTAAHVVASLGSRVDLVLDGGPTLRGIESTVVDLTGEFATILRPGALSRAAVGSALAGVGRRLLVRGLPAEDGPGPARSPGLSDRHYAPSARLLLVATADLGKTLAREGRGVTVKVLSYSALFADGVSLPADPVRYAERLYATLRELDRTADLIVVEEPPRTDAWEAVLDRLHRAARPADPL